MGAQQQPLEDNHASFPPNMKNTDVLVKLEKLQTLRKSGTVNETAFMVLKSRLLKDAC
ncbi:MAG: hypothetical protein ABJN04_06695 [Hyphomicrobiales bacterium]